MRRLLAALIAVLAGLTLSAAPAQAITGHFAKDFQHEYVGLIVFDDAQGNPMQRCSGSLLTDRVFLTAGHCVTVDDHGTLAASARIYFEQDAGVNYDPALGYDPVTGYPVTGGVTAHEIYSYGFTGTRPQSRDVGLVILDQPVTDKYPNVDTYASLAAAGTLDTYGTGVNAKVDLSGYGVTNPNKNHPVSYRERLMATTFILGGHNPRLKSQYNVQLAMNPGGGRGGTCFGDSGGPVLVHDTDVIVAVNSFAINSQCTGQGYGYRTDQQEVLDWILLNAGSEAREINIVTV
jgi:Trypsin